MNLFARGKQSLAFALLLAGTTLAHANVGDTVPQLRQRYGSGQNLGGQMLFEVRLVSGQFVPARGSANTPDHLTITVYFDGPNSAMEVFTRNTSDPTKAELSQADVSAILAAAVDGQEWHPIAVATDRPTWVTTDKKLVARFSPNKTGKIEDASVLAIMLNSNK